ncbi:MAG TPA: YkgJ family cysteine cluster protein [Verrucomicrobiae bacterium]|nr:YkgJ family cysteine cluster protein [Verrucomicrobiae bacterium]
MSRCSPAQTVTTNNLCLACGLCCNGVIFADVKLQPDDSAEALRNLGLPLKRLPQKARKTAPSPAPPTAFIDPPLLAVNPVNPASAAAPMKFTQPCPAYADCRCQIYAQRPQHCRSFECLLLKSVKAGSTTPPAALTIIQTARQRAEAVRQLLHDLGDHNEHLPLARRFRQLARKVEQTGLDEETTDKFGRLTLALHDLNLLLSEEFF